MKIILEGANGVGKSTVSSILRESIPESTFIEFHDFYHEHVVNQLKQPYILREEDWDRIPSKEKKQADHYILKRSELVFDFFKAQKLNRIVVERLILSHLVYKEIILKQNCDTLLDSYQALLERFSNLDIMLVLVTCDNCYLRKVLEKRNEKSYNPGSPYAQFHLRSVDVGLRKNDMYLKYFHKIGSVQKIVIENNGNGVLDLKEQVLQKLKIRELRSF